MFPCDTKLLKALVEFKSASNCTWLVRLNPKAELPNEKKGCHASKWKVLDKNEG